MRTNTIQVPVLTPSLLPLLAHSLPSLLPQCMVYEVYGVPLLAPSP
jgi:hypothetical protein